MARARACPSVVLPTPGTPSMSRCPRAKMLTRARRTTSSLPRITRRRAFSNSTALVDTARAVSGDISFDSNLMVREWRSYYGHGAFGSLLFAVSSWLNPPAKEGTRQLYVLQAQLLRGIRAVRAKR